MSKELQEKVAEYSRTKSPTIAKEIMVMVEPKIEAQVKKWSGSIPEYIIRAEAHKATKRALDTYNPNYGTSFTTHLYNHLQTISRVVYENQNIIRLPEHMVQDITTYKNATAEFYSEHGYDPSIKELQDSLKWPTTKIKKMQQSIQGATPQSAGTYLQDEMELEVLAKETLVEIMNELDFEEQRIFSELTGFNSRGDKVFKPKSDTEVCKTLHITRSQLAYRKKQMETKIKKVLRAVRGY